MNPSPISLRAVLLAGFCATALHGPAVAQSLDELDDDPAVLAEAFVRNRVRPHEAALTGGAAATRLNPANFPKAPAVRVAEQWRVPGYALVAAELSNSASATDLYLFVDSTAAGWRIAAVREFELPGIYYRQLERYRNQGERSIRAAYEERFRASAERGVSRGEHERVHGTADDRVFQVFNLRLASGADRDLARHHEVLRARFDELRGLLEAMPPSPLPRALDDETVGDLLRYLLVREAYRPAQGPLRLVVAEVDGKELGYLYCAEAACMPTPTPNGIVALRDLGAGWYLYRRV